MCVECIYTLALMMRKPVGSGSTSALSSIMETGQLLAECLYSESVQVNYIRCQPKGRNGLNARCLYIVYFKIWQLWFNLGWLHLSFMADKVAQKVSIILFPSLVIVPAANKLFAEQNIWGTEPSQEKHETNLQTLLLKGLLVLLNSISHNIPFLAGKDITASCHVRLYHTTV
jgi:hypothetical protein